jgi:hypothetical protein
MVMEKLALSTQLVNQILGYLAWLAEGNTPLPADEVKGDLS